MVIKDRVAQTRRNSFEKQCMDLAYQSRSDSGAMLNANLL
jgi:hypothetical protein